MAVSSSAVHAENNEPEMGPTLPDQQQEDFQERCSVRQSSAQLSAHNEHDCSNQSLNGTLSAGRDHSISELIAVIHSPMLDFEEELGEPFELSNSFLQQIGEEHTLSSDLTAFYDKFKYEFLDVYDNLSEIDPPLDALHDSAANRINFFFGKVHTILETKQLYQLINNKVSLCTTPLQESLSSTFKIPESFATYVSKASKWSVVKKGCKKASISLKGFLNCRGVFKPRWIYSNRKYLE